VRGRRPPSALPALFYIRDVQESPSSALPVTFQRIKDLIRTDFTAQVPTPRSEIFQNCVPLGSSTRAYEG
jgi:hypothetical protein